MPLRQRATPDERLQSRVQGEFLEMPGLRLTLSQAQRLWGLDVATCQRVLDALEGRRFLVRDAEGRYTRPSDRWPGSALQMAKADVSRPRKLKVP
jgi:hypothetical protein